MKIDRARIHHVVSKVATLSLGALYVGPSAVAFRNWLDRKQPAPRFSGRAAIVAHAYYPALLGEVLRCFEYLPAGSDLIITVPEKKIGDLADLVGRADLGDRVKIVPVQNRGRDVAPFLALLSAGALDGYDAVLKIHTKRSPHLRDGEIRRRLLFSSLAGSRRQVAAILRLFEDSATGLVGWRAAWRRTPHYWMGNRNRVEGLAEAMTSAAEPAFFEGTMFWLRPKALKRLAQLGLTTADFEPEQGQLDGALHHAIERSFALAVASEGFVTVDTAGRQLFPAARAS